LFQAEDGIRAFHVTGVQTCALPIYLASRESLVPLNLLARQAVIDLKPRLDLSVSVGYRGLSDNNDAVSPLHDRMTGGNGRLGLRSEERRVGNGGRCRWRRWPRDATE